MSIFRSTIAALLAGLGFAAVAAVAVDPIGVSRPTTAPGKQQTRSKLDRVDAEAGLVLLDRQAFLITQETVIYLLPPHGRKRIYSLTEIPADGTWVRYELTDDGKFLKALYIYTGEAPD